MITNEAKRFTAVRLPPDLRDAIERIAADEDRSINRTITRLLRDAINRHSQARQ